MADTPGLMTLPEVAAARGVTPYRLRRAVRTRLPALLAAGLVVRGTLVLVRPDMIEEQLALIDTEVDNAGVRGPRSRGRG